MAEPPSLYKHQSRRSVVHSTRGIVSSSQPLASQAGIQILQQGGNAAVLPLLIDSPYANQHPRTPPSPSPRL
jgi:hypothetical protein